VGGETDILGCFFLVDIHLEMKMYYILHFFTSDRIR
jgi:hypothetical protein